MSLESDIELLSRVPLFKVLNIEQLRLLAFSGVHRKLRYNDVLFREGDHGQSAFVVVSGEISLTRGEGTKKKILTTCEEGALIGEMALFVATRRPAAAIAARLSDVLEISRELMLRMLSEYPDVAARMQATMADRVANTMSGLGRVKSTLDQIDVPGEQRQAN